MGELFFTPEYTIPLVDEINYPPTQIEEKYRIWIDALSDNSIINGCGSQSRSMVQTFPELKLVLGVVKLENGGREEHAWCVDNNGVVIDPTAKQYELRFNSKPVEYQALDSTQTSLIPIGKCPNCGWYYYPEDDKFGGVCSQECFDSYSSYILSC